MSCAQNGTPPPTSESDVLKKLFHREVESSAQTWSFFDDILMKYLDYAAASAASGGGGGGEEKDELSGASETKESFGDRLTWWERTVCCAVSCCVNVICTCIASRLLLAYFFWLFGLTAYLSTYLQCFGGHLPQRQRWLGAIYFRHICGKWLRPWLQNTSGCWQQ